MQNRPVCIQLEGRAVVCRFKIEILSFILMWPVFGLLLADTVPNIRDGRAVRIRDGCERLNSFQDNDVQRNARLLRQAADLCLSRRVLSENGLTWTFTIISNKAHKSGPTIFLLHDNENTAFDAALYGVRKYGGKLVAVESGEHRKLQQVQDPNRNFGMTAEQTSSCGLMREKPAAGFTELLLDLQGRDAGFFLTLHNNADGYYLGGNRGGVRLARRTSLIYGMLLPMIDDPDDAILLAGQQYLFENKTASKAADYFRKSGINVIYERIIPRKNDCSFSNFVVLNGLGTYYNIEAQHGHLTRQKQMLDALMRYNNISPYVDDIK